MISSPGLSPCLTDLSGSLIGGGLGTPLSHHCHQTPMIRLALVRRSFSFFTKWEVPICGSEASRYPRWPSRPSHDEQRSSSCGLSCSHGPSAGTSTFGTLQEPWISVMIRPSWAVTYAPHQLTLVSRPATPCQSYGESGRHLRKGRTAWKPSERPLHGLFERISLVLFKSGSTSSYSKVVWTNRDRPGRIESSRVNIFSQKACRTGNRFLSGLGGSPYSSSTSRVRPSSRIEAVRWRVLIPLEEAVACLDRPQELVPTPSEWTPAQVGSWIPRSYRRHSSCHCGDRAPKGRNVRELPAGRCLRACGPPRNRSGSGGRQSLDFERS